MSDERIVAELLQEGLDDWISLNSLLWFTTGGQITEESKERTLRILQRLYAAGLFIPGDLGETGFEPWEGSVQDWLRRSAGELDAIGWNAVGAGFWLNLTEGGEVSARERNSHDHSPG